MYFQKESNTMFKSPDLNHLYKLVIDHRRANNYPIGVDIKQEIDNYICEQNPELCDDDTPEHKWTVPQLAVKLAKAMGAFIKSGARIVTAEQFQQRKQICLNCDKWRGESMLGLGACAACGCSALKLGLVSEKCPLNKWPIL